MSPLLAVLLLCAGPARAGDASTPQDRVQIGLWSWTSLEALPDLSAESRFRAEEQLRLDLRTDSGWRVDALGAVRDRTMPETDITGDLYRLSVRRNVGSTRLGVGRLVRPGAQGFQRLDGLVVDAGRTRQLGLSFWGGRPWHPEEWDVGNSWVLGGELQASPGSGWLRTAVGTEARLAEGEVGLRVHGLAAARSTSGSRAALFAELAPLEDHGDLPALRSSLSGGLPLGELVDLSAAARWEGLTQAGQPEALTSPMDWLSGDGYGVLDLGARVGQERWALGASGGPSLRPDAQATLGGLGRAWGTWQAATSVRLGLTGTGARVEDSWIAGGIGEATFDQGLLTLRAQGGLFRSQGISGPTADVWEGRLSTRAALPVHSRSVQDLALVATVAAGSDRILSSWGRGALTLQGRFGNLPVDAP